MCYGAYKVKANAKPPNRAPFGYVVVWKVAPAQVYQLRKTVDPDFPIVSLPSVFPNDLRTDAGLNPKRLRGDV